MKNNRRKVCVVLVDRANYGRLKPVMQALATHPEIELQTIATGSMVLERFDFPVKVLYKDGFKVNAEIYIELEGSTTTTMAKSVGFATIELASEFHRLKPDIVVLIGDRYEAMAAALAAAYMNICLFHVQGGEVSGSIDESTRHAISKFAQFHFPSTKRSAEYLERMGENPDSIVGVGCPSSDIARKLDTTLLPEIINSTGSGIEINVSNPFLLVLFHPTTTEYGNENNQMQELLNALDKFKIQTVLLWPNIDAGSDRISKVIRMFRDRTQLQWLRTLINLSPENYLKVLANASCAIGNSSSFVRDASYFGTPVVLVGNRQNGRECAEHLTRVSPKADDIERAVRRQLDKRRYPPSVLYGDGYVSERIAEGIATIKPYIQKTLHYIHDDE